VVDAVLAEIVQRYGNGAGFQDQGNADITTRQNWGDPD